MPGPWAPDGYCVWARARRGPSPRCRPAPAADGPLRPLHVPGPPSPVGFSSPVRWRAGRRRAGDAGLGGAAELVWTGRDRCRSVSVTFFEGTRFSKARESRCPTGGSDRRWVRQVVLGGAVRRREGPPGGVSPIAVGAVSPGAAMRAAVCPAPMTVGVSGALRGGASGSVAATVLGLLAVLPLLARPPAPAWWRDGAPPGSDAVRGGAMARPPAPVRCVVARSCGGVAVVSCDDRLVVRPPRTCRLVRSGGAARSPSQWCCHLGGEAGHAALALVRGRRVPASVVGPCGAHPVTIYGPRLAAPPGAYDRMPAAGGVRPRAVGRTAPLPWRGSSSRAGAGGFAPLCASCARPRAAHSGVSGAARCRAGAPARLRGCLPVPHRPVGREGSHGSVAASP